MAEGFTILDAMRDPKLFGPTFGRDSFAAWRGLLAAFYALPMDDHDRQAVSDLTARPALPSAAASELWIAVGRRGGKSHVAALIAVYEAAFRDHRAKLAPGEVATVLLIAADRAQARTLLRYVRGLFDNPMLRRMVVRETNTGFELSNRSVIEVGTASHRAVRGYTIAAVICDEIAFWMADGASPDAEIIAALRPALATLDGRLIAISSPYARRGVLWDTFRRHHGNADSDRVLTAQAPSRTMNPNIPEHVVEEAMRDDPARGAAEWLAQFRTDVETFLPAEVVVGAQRERWPEIPRQETVHYWAFVDPSGGGADEFTVAIGHREDERIVVDLVRGRKGNPAAITADFCGLVASYGVGKVYGDRYSGEWVRTEFRRHRITYLDAPGVRSELYQDLGSALQAGRVELPPCPTLERQLCALERRTTRTGRDIIDHPPGGHDDRANAVAGLVSLMGSDKRREKLAVTKKLKGLL